MFEAIADRGLQKGTAAIVRSRLYSLMLDAFCERLAE